MSAVSRQQDKGSAFRAMHAGDPFVIPNPWDTGSARVLEALGFEALATTSSGFAFTLGRLDGQATLDEVAAHVESLVRATDLPVSVDLENGYAEGPAVAITRIAEAGAVGGSIEDWDPSGRLYELPNAVERVVDGRRPAAFERQRELDRSVVAQVAERQPDQRDSLTFDHRQGRDEQPSRDVQDRRGVRGRLRHRVRTRRPREVVEPQTKRDRSADSVGLPQPARETIRQRDEVGVEHLGRSRPSAERALCPDRSAAASDLDRPGIPVVGQSVQVPTGGAAEQVDEPLLAELRDLRHRRDRTLAQLGRGDRPDAPEALDRKRMQELELPVGRDDQEAVGLGDAARDLGEELRSGHPDGDGQANLLEDLPSEPNGDLGRRARDPPQPPDVEEGLVDREPLDEGRRVLEHPEHRLARLAVGLHPRADDHRVGAEPPGEPATHRGSDAVGLRLVARGEHDPGAHDDGTPSERRVVPLFDRGIEGVRVCVQDGRLVAHLRMLAPAEDAPGRSGACGCSTWRSRCGTSSERSTSTLGSSGSIPRRLAGTPTVSSSSTT